MIYSLAFFNSSTDLSIALTDSISPEFACCTPLRTAILMM
ncbi:hypothetical protein UF75_3407 [Desulfosporosinus sp. I2]|nr:hypothetical protein UF75_3407 [Desulfosporosinus sp. I2]